MLFPGLFGAAGQALDRERQAQRIFAEARAEAMAKQNSKRIFPDEVFVYVGDTVDDKPVLYVATDIDAIPEDSHGDMVATYRLGRLRKFKVKRELD